MKEKSQIIELSQTSNISLGRRKITLGAPVPSQNPAGISRKNLINFQNKREHDDTRIIKENPNQTLMNFCLANFIIHF
jgi:hypothetical protein